jgi:hypothetical protein
MTALDLLTVLCAVLALGAAATLSVMASRAARAAKELEAATRQFTEQAIPAIDELRVAATRATSEVDRVDDLLEVAGSIGGRVDAATEATYRALTSPMIKGVAFASGTRRAAARLRGRSGDPSGAARAPGITAGSGAGAHRRGIGSGRTPSRNRTAGR